MNTRLAACLSISFITLFPLCSRAAGDEELAPAQPATGSAASTAAPTSGDRFTQEELDQMLAPIALYPDSLLSQIFMASTYPLEVVEADRWAQSHKDMKPDAAAKDLESETWDPSVKSLVNFPGVLSMLSDKLDWTRKIGDAFLGQQTDVMSTVQKLRSKAKDTGHLDSTKEQNVKVEQSGAAQVITIESTSPEVIYVPSYNPTVVYGSWWYPAYPPYPYYPPGYIASNTVSFAAGIACGFAWGYAWGHCDWHHGDIDIDINRNTNFNRNINRDKYTSRNGGEWRHDPSHRGGVGYRDSRTAQQFGGRTSAQAAQARDAYRGRAEQGRADLARGDADRFRNQPAARPGQGGAGTRREPSATPRNSGGAFDGVNHGARQTQQSSNRGWSSRGSSRPAPARGGGSRGGGGRRR